MLRPNTFCTLYGLISLLLLFQATACLPFAQQVPAALLQRRGEEASFIGWHTSKVTKKTGPSDYSLPNLALAVLRNARGDTDGFTLAVFKDKTAMDANGKVSALDPKVYDHFLALAGKINGLPAGPGTFGNSWTLTGGRMNAPNDQLYISDDKKGIKLTSVRGFNPEKPDAKALDKKWEGYEDLPPCLFEMTRLVLEGRQGFGVGDVVDSEVVKKLKTQLKAL